jgi:murein DD-endopeptidase MepM/ murein hydrolase activator NlpD
MARIVSRLHNPIRFGLVLLFAISSVGPMALTLQPRAARAAALVLPADTRLPFEGSRYWTGGPHGNDTLVKCEPIPVARGSGLDFSGGFPVLSIARGVFIGKGTPGGGRGNVVLIEHDGGIQSMYWHLADGFSHDLNRITPGTSIPRGFPIGTSGMSGTDAVHLHLELQTGGDEIRQPE